MSKSNAGANPERARAESERAKSNAAGTHQDRRTHRERSREAARRVAIKRSEEDQ